MALYNAGLKSLQPGVFTRSYDHATKLFLADNYRLTPKQSFLYYVIFTFDPAISAIQSGIGAILSIAERYQSFETGMLVKRADLPKFQINTKTVNAYNRKNILQTGLLYENSQIVFHDDAADVITNFWNDYYTYYFRDSDYGIDQYRNPYRYNLRSTVGWGFTPRNQSIPNFFANIRLFSLHNKRFTEYMLINPVITNWKHGALDSRESTQLLENSMTVSFESVKYFTGYINPINVDGFSLLHYDNTPSPISTSTTNIYSDAGLIGVIDGVAKDLRKPDGTDGSGGVVSSLLSMYRAYNNLKKVNLKNVVGSTITQLGAGVINSVLNGTGNYIFPTVNNQSYIQGSGYQNPNTFAASITGGATGFAVGQAVQRSLSDTGTAATRGFGSFIGGTSTSNPILDAAQSSGQTIRASGSQQVPTGTTTAYYLDEQGSPISEFTSRDTNGKYNPSDPTTNLRYVETTYDSSGTPTVRLTYADGTVRTEDAEGNLLGIEPGNIKNPVINVNPQSSASQAAAGSSLPTGGLRTQQVGNRTQTVGGATTGLVTSTVSGVLGVGAGVVSGAAIFQALNRTGLGNNVIGRTLNAAIATTTGAAVGQAVQKGVTPLINEATKNVTQFFDPVTKEIKNVVGGWFGGGGYDKSKPTENIVSQTINAAGSTVFTYKDGTVRTVDLEGNQTVVKGTNNKGLFDFSFGNDPDIGAVGPNSVTPLFDSEGNAVLTGHGATWNNTPYAGEDDLLSADASSYYNSSTPFGGSTFNDEGSF